MSHMTCSMVFLGGGHVLAGAINGKVCFAALVKEIKEESSTPAPLFLDFTDIQIATASFLRESVFALKNYLRAINSNHYPVIANVNQETRDEILTIANAKGDAFLECDLVKDHYHNVDLIGHLDPKQQLTFNLVNDLKRTDAAELMECCGDAENLKSATAWNNRLSSLVSRGIIREFTKGRAKYYKPILEVVE